MKSWTCIGLAVLEVFAAGSSATFGQSNSTPFLQDYELPKSKIRAGFVPYKAQLVLGEPLKVTFTVENLGPTNFEFWFGGDYRGTGRHDRFKITATNEIGESLPDPIAHPMDFGGMMWPVNLRPGQLFTNDIDLTAFRVLDKAGFYIVNCSFAFAESAHQERQTNPVVNTTFKLTILERTSERVAIVLDELTAKVRTLGGEALGETLALMARFGKEDAVPRLVALATNGPSEVRAAAIGVLPLVPTDASLEVAVRALQDSDAVVAAAAANSLAVMEKPRAVDALLSALPRVKPPVSEAIVIALGTSKSPRALPVITNVFDAGESELQRAAISALVNYGGSNAVAALRQHLNTNYLALRYEVVLALVEKLHEPLQADWLSPVLIGREQNHEWLDSIRLLRMYAGDKAIPELLSYLDFDTAWSGRNWWILDTGVKPCPNAPPIDYEYDPNSDGTPEQWTNNLHTLQRLKPLADPIRGPSVRAGSPPVPYLVTDPPIDFTPGFRELETGGVEIKSGFLNLTLWRTGADLPYAVSDPYLEIYRLAARFRSLPEDPKRCAELGITSEQVKTLKELLHRFAVELCGPHVSDQRTGNLYNLLVFQSDYCTGDDDWTSLFSAYKEAPSGPLREQAKADLIDSVRVFSQNYHAGTVEFAESAKKIFTPGQLEQILK